MKKNNNVSKPPPNHIIKVIALSLTLLFSAAQAQNISVATGGTGGVAATPNVQFKEVLLELKVTPTITQDNRVFLNMNVKKDEVDSYLPVTNFGVVPIINRREINTAVLVDDGQTVVIGGVYEFSDKESVAKVPFLARLLADPGAVDDLTVTEPTLDDLYAHFLRNEAA